MVLARRPSASTRRRATSRLASTSSISSAFDDDLPNDDDLFRMIRDGMPGTAMPGWSDLLSDDDMWNVIAYIKTFAELEGEPEGQVDYGTQVKSSPESIAAGKKLFHADDRCSECHGAEGKGDAIKKLKNDNGERTWPRNLTKPWTFRASNDPKISTPAYRRVFRRPRCRPSPTPRARKN